MIRTKTAYIAACLILFAIAMTGVWYFLNYLVRDIGLWTIVPWLALMFFLGWLIDRREQRQRSARDH
jgi:hypothetical protein